MEGGGDWREDDSTNVSTICLLDPGSTRARLTNQPTCLASWIAVRVLMSQPVLEILLTGACCTTLVLVAGGEVTAGGMVTTGDVGTALHGPSGWSGGGRAYWALPAFCVYMHV